MSNPVRPPEFSQLKYCPDPLPPDLTSLACALATAWINSPHRPLISREALDHWSALIEEWVETEDMPLFVRKHRRDRGHLVPHCSGRNLVPCDNSAAHWAYALALCGLCPSLVRIRAWLEADQIPLAMALSQSESSQAHYKSAAQPASLNGLGWKICHIDSVGIRLRGRISDLPIDDLKKHFRRYMSPSNMFLVPKAWGGLGEMPEMCDAARAVCRQESS